MSDKLFRGVTIALTVFIVILLLQAGREIFYDYNYNYDEDNMLYTIRDKEYTQLLYQVEKNKADGVKVTDGMAECYAVAEYYQAAMLYYTYEETGNQQMQAKAKADMEDAASRMGALVYCEEEISQLLENYLAEH